MRKNLLVIMATMSVPFLLFLNVWQSQRYMTKYFEAKGLISTQENIVLDNKRLLNRVAELETPTRIANIAESKLLVRKVEGNDVVKLKVVVPHE